MRDDEPSIVRPPICFPFCTHTQQTLLTFLALYKNMNTRTWPLHKYTDKRVFASDETHHHYSLFSPVTAHPPPIHIPCPSPFFTLFPLTPTFLHLTLPIAISILGSSLLSNTTLETVYFSYENTNLHDYGLLSY